MQQYNSVKMEYKKIINLIEDTPNQPSKFRTKERVEFNVGSFGTYNTGSQIEFKTLMINSNYVILVTLTYFLKEL